MNENCSTECQGLRTVRSELSQYRVQTDARLAKGDVTLATINTKLNWLVGILSAIGAAVMGAALKFIAG